MSEPSVEKHSGILGDLFLLVIPLSVAVIAGTIVLYGRAAGFSIVLDTTSIDFATTIFFTLILVGLLFYGLKRHPEKSARVIVAGVTVAGTISGLVLFKVWVEASQLSPIVFLAALPIGYMGLNWSVREYFGALSERKTHLLMIGSATLLGSLIGTSFPPIFSIVFLLALVTLDVVIVESRALPNIVGETAYDEMVSVATLPLDKYLVGLGDFLAYAIVTTTALRLFGLYGAIATAILVLIGAILTFQVTRIRSRAPGLLIPIGMALIPILLGVLVF